MSMESVEAMYEWGIDRYKTVRDELPGLGSLMLGSFTVLMIILVGMLSVILCWSNLYSVVVPIQGRSLMIYLQYGEYRIPYSKIELTPFGEYFSSNQVYNLNLDLIIPNNQRNIQLGNFMINLNLLDQQGLSLLNSSRPASIPYQSPLASSLSTLSPLSILFKHSNSHHLTIPLLEAQVLQSKRLIPSSLYIEIGRRDAHPTNERFNGGTGELQVYQAKLIFDAHLTGLRWLLYHHSILSFMLFTPLFLLLELSTAFAIWLLIAYRGSIVTTSPIPSASSSTASSAEEDKFNDDNDEFKPTIKIEPLSAQSLFEQEAAARSARSAREQGRGSDMASVLGDLGLMEESSTDVGDNDEQGEGGSGASWEGIEAESEVDVALQATAALPGETGVAKKDEVTI